MTQLLLQRRFLQALGLADEGQIFPDGLLQVQRRALRQIADASFGLGRLLEDVIAAHRHPSFRGGKAAGEDVHGGRFSRAVRPQQAVDDPLLNVEGEVRDGGVAAIAFGQPSYFDQSRSLPFCPAEPGGPLVLTVVGKTETSLKEAVNKL